MVLKLRTSIELADLEEICTPSPEGQCDGLSAFLSDITAQLRALTDAITQMYFSHAMVSQMLTDVRTEAEA